MDSADEFQSSSLDPRSHRKTYLVTYSQANRILYPTRESFGQDIVGSFNSGESKVKVLYWACCLESHANGGDHYHLALKLSGSKRWKSVKDHMQNIKGIVVNFSDTHQNYYTAFKYITKSDPNIFLSQSHPNLEEMNPPKTSKCLSALRKKHARSANNTVVEEPKKKEKKSKRLSNYDVYKYISQNEIQSEDQLYSIAHTQEADGKTDLAVYLLSRSRKSVGELFENANRMNSATATVQRATMNRMQILEAALTKECICEGEWLRCAKEVLTNNGIHPFVFADRLRTLLIHGRGKLRNIIIVGPANCGKTFLLRPIETIFETFSNPAHDKYGWVGSDKVEAIFLNDFRWSSELIKWNDFLLLLEGHTVHLPAPKNHYSSDMCLDKDTPIFATSIKEITFVGRCNVTDERENEMMAARWHVFKFIHQIPCDKQKDIAPCGKCFAELATLGS